MFLSPVAEVNQPMPTILPMSHLPSKVAPEAKV